MKINIGGTLINGNNRKLIDKINKILFINNIGSIITIETEEKDNTRIIYEISIKFKNKNNKIFNFVSVDYHKYNNSLKNHKKELNKSLKNIILDCLCFQTFYKNDLIND